MTLVAGAVATIAGAFPNLSAQLLGFVGTYGTVLGPMGAVIFVDFYLMKKFGLRDEYATHSGTQVNVAVMIAWLLPVCRGSVPDLLARLVRRLRRDSLLDRLRCAVPGAQQVHAEIFRRTNVRLAG